MADTNENKINFLQRLRVITHFISLDPTEGKGSFFASLTYRSYTKKAVVTVATPSSSTQSELYIAAARIIIPDVSPDILALMEGYFTHRPDGRRMSFDDTGVYYWVQGTWKSMAWPISDAYSVWDQFYHDLVVVTEAQNKAEIQQRVSIYRALGLINHDGVATMKNHQATLLSPESTVQHIESCVSPATLEVASLMLNGIITNVRIYHTESSGNTTTKKAVFNYGHRVNLETPAFKLERDSHCVTDNTVIYATIVEMVKGATAQTAAGNVTFGTSDDKMGIFEVVQADTDLLYFSQTKDGHWHAPPAKSSVATRCLFDAKELGPNPWVNIAFKFAEIYDPAKEYMILADCAPNDSQHPAVALWRIIG